MRRLLLALLMFLGAISSLRADMVSLHRVELWTKFDPEGLFGDSYGEMSDEAQFQNDSGHWFKAGAITLAQQTFQLASLGSYSGWSHAAQSIGEAMDNTQTNADEMKHASAEQAVQIQTRQVENVKKPLPALAAYAGGVPGTSLTGPPVMPTSSESAVAEATVANAITKDATAAAKPSASAQLAAEIAGGAMDANKLNHIFGQSKHGLEALVKQFGSPEAAYKAMQQATEAAVQSKKLTGVFETTVKIGTETVTVRGNVVNGAVKIGTAFK